MQPRYEVNLALSVSAVSALHRAAPLFPTVFGVTRKLRWQARALAAKGNEFDKSINALKLASTNAMRTALAVEGATKIAIAEMGKSVRSVVSRQRNTGGTQMTLRTRSKKRAEMFELQRLMVTKPAELAALLLDEKESSV